MIKSVMKTNNFAQKSEIEKLCVAYQMNKVSQLQIPHKVWDSVFKMPHEYVLCILAAVVGGGNWQKKTRPTYNTTWRQYTENNFKES